LESSPGRGGAPGQSCCNEDSNEKRMRLGLNFYPESEGCSALREVPERIKGSTG